MVTSRLYPSGGTLKDNGKQKSSQWLDLQVVNLSSSLWGKKKQFGFGINKDSGSGEWFGQRPRKRDLKIGTEKSVVLALGQTSGSGHEV